MSALWYGMVISLAGRLRHKQAAVPIGELLAGLELHYHALGGALSRRVVGDSRFAWHDPEQVHLPRRIDRYGSPELNRELYYWQAAFLALDHPLEREPGMPAGVRHLMRGAATSARVIEKFPALAERYRRLCAAELAHRESALPRWDEPAKHPARVLEAWIRVALRTGTPPEMEWAHDAAYLPFLPVPLWGHKSAIRGPRWSAFKRSRRRREEGRERPLGRPRFDPARRPERSGGAAARGRWLYPEWAFARGEYRADWCAVSERLPAGTSAAAFGASSAARAERTRRQFEALRQQPVWERRRDSGEELDLDACVESAADARGCGHRSERVYRRRVLRRSRLSVAALMDCSRSTAAWVGEHRVVTIAREGMLVLAEALAAAGDDFGLFAFASDTRLRVRCYRIKGFDETYGEASRQRLLALQPERYTRMGAAIRHVGVRLDGRPAAHKLLLILTDGRPHDPADGYEGRYALEDTRRSLLELRARGIHSYGLAIDRRGRDYLPRLFGSGHYSVLSDPQSLPQALPRLYARLTHAR